MKSVITSVAVAGILAFAATTAQAAVYNFTGNGNGSSSFYSYTEDGVKLTVTAGHYHSSGSSSGQVHTGENVTKSHYSGLGVSSYSGDNGQIDGYRENDVLLFSFDSAVKFVSATFSSISGDDFTWFFDDDDNGSLSYDLVGSADPSGSTYSFTQDYIGQLFGIAAIGSSDDFRVKSINVNTLSAVPLPAALPLYGAGLAVMGFVGWRKRQKAAAQA
jgi:hypothetical protein